MLNYKTNIIIDVLIEEKTYDLHILKNVMHTYLCMVFVYYVIVTKICYIFSVSLDGSPTMLLLYDQS